MGSLKEILKQGYETKGKARRPKKGRKAKGNFGTWEERQWQAMNPTHPFHS